MAKKFGWAHLIGAGILILLVAYPFMAGYVVVTSTGVYLNPNPGLPSSPQVTYTTTYSGGGASYHLPIIGTVVSNLNSTPLQGLTVNMYTLSGDTWNLVASSTSSSTAGSLGQFSSAGTLFTTGEIVMIQVVHGTATSPVVKVNEVWTQVAVPTGQGVSPTSLNLGNIGVDVIPSSAAHIYEKMFDGSNNAIGTTDATATSLSKASGAADLKGSLLVYIDQANTAFGASVNVPKTNTGVVARDLHAMVYVEFNVTTGIVMNSLIWEKATASNPSYTRYVTTVDRLYNYNDVSVGKKSLDFQVGFSAITTDTPIHMSVGYVDQQLPSQVIGGTIYAGVSPNPGYNYLDTADFYVTIAA